MVKVSFLGDISLNNCYNKFYENDINPFRGIEQLLKQSDFNIGNLECLAKGDKGENKLNQNPLTSKVGAISVGIVAGELVADLDYEKDSNAEVDLNLVLDEKFEILEIQGTAEGKPFSKEHLDQLFELGKECIKEVFEIQK